jgi:hypothetical protein
MTPDMGAHGGPERTARSGDATDGRGVALGVRQVAFRSDGTVDDLGLFPTGADSAAIVGAIGVQP